MSQLIWTDMPDVNVESGIDKGVLYLTPKIAVPWNGIVRVKELETSEEKTQYQDGVKQVGIRSNSDFGISIQAYTYPEELDTFPGVAYAFSYRTKINDIYRIHIIYSPTFTINDKMFNSTLYSFDDLDFTWDASTIPMDISNCAPSSNLYIEFPANTPDFWFEMMDELFYDMDNKEYNLPTPNELIVIFEEFKLDRTLLIINHSDGAWSAFGSDDNITYVDDTTFEIDAPSAMFIDDVTYTLESF